MDVAAFYAEADRDPRGVDLTPDFVARYAENWEQHPQRAFIDRVKAISMLHQQTLLLLNFFARRARGPGD